jgi:hypothetical protein
LDEQLPAGIFAAFDAFIQVTLMALTVLRDKRALRCASGIAQQVVLNG